MQANILHVYTPVFVHTVCKGILATISCFPILFKISLNEPQEKVEGIEKDTCSPRVAWSISEGVPKMTESSKSPGFTVLL